MGQATILDGGGGYKLYHIHMVSYIQIAMNLKVAIKL